MEESSTSRFLKGKTWPGSNQQVKSVTVEGNLRHVHLKGGGTVTTNKQGLTSHLHTVLQTEQAVKAKRSIRETENGKAKVTIGGKERGERKEYASRAGAERAIDRAYPKAQA